jgi:uncharacterized Zn finger protein
MQIRCPNCKIIFDADKQQQQLLDQAIESKQRLIIIECPNCYKDVPIDPGNLLSFDSQKDEQPQDQIPCPICKEGLVAYIDNGIDKFWGCGECGTVWHSKEDLNNARADQR